MTAPGASLPNGPAALVGDDPIPLSEVDTEAAGELLKLRAQEYEIRRRVLDDMVVRRLLAHEAAARSLTVEDLTRVEIQEKAGAPSNDEIRAYYEANKARYGKDTLDDAAPYIRDALTQQRVFKRRLEFIGELRAKSSVRILIDAPRLPVTAGDSPALGPSGAPVTIIEFSDYQCPFCGRLAPTLRQLVARYGDRVRLVYREFPLDMHENAMNASLAGLCARDQGKFWEMNDRLFANQDKLGPADLKAHAAALGLDAARFGECFDSARYKARVRKDQDDGTRWGVGSTPSLFVNGRPMVGAKPIEQYIQLIDEELERAGSAAPRAAGAPLR